MFQIAAFLLYKQNNVNNMHFCIRKVCFITQKVIPLQCVFHGIRFKVKKIGCRDDNQFFLCLLLRAHVIPLNFRLLHIASLSRALHINVLF